MEFLCIKYSGLKFHYIFETNDFVFIPAKKVEVKERDRLEVEEIFTCTYDKNSDFYVLLKEPSEIDFTLEGFTEEILYDFKLLESMINLLFSNYLKRDSIFILEKRKSEFSIKKIFKNLYEVNIEVNHTFLWDSNIVIHYLEEMINAGFNKFKSITNKKDFALRYSFCVGMYIRGKFGENRLRRISDLWISLEILSVITISHIMHSH